MPRDGGPPSKADQLYDQLRIRLMEGGDWDRLQILLAHRLNESGWLDDVRHRAKEAARVMEPLSFASLLEEIQDNAKASVPENVRGDITGLIRRHVEKQFEA